MNEIENRIAALKSKMESNDSKKIALNEENAEIKKNIKKLERISEELNKMIS